MESKNTSSNNIETMNILFNLQQSILKKFSNKAVKNHPFYSFFLQGLIPYMMFKNWQIMKDIQPINLRVFL